MDQIVDRSKSTHVQTYLSSIQFEAASTALSRRDGCDVAACPRNGKRTRIIILQPVDTSIRLLNDHSMKTEVAPRNMNVWELRRYRAPAGRAEDLRRRFLEAALPGFERNGMRLLGLWQSFDNSHEFWYILGFKSKQHREDAWSSLRQDPVWQEARESSEFHGPIVLEQDSVLMRGLAECETLIEEVQE
ncbi:NIPSNAP family protein [Arthrobacter sulfonylureivorans]|uniref:NIPSNAP family protein n=1 Tax=Arthrobacter sulfonylureivorans TaxID=2486855 RepID=A0ABY3WEI9_9MICC|nr:NIPSNAP family protein [Arthrobacter sulfonylureivorans]UNK47876.1 NIPSNAP family protein [Arthrobacter sulfonylureivorans]